jgi:hypothetical protein
MLHHVPLGKPPRHHCNLSRLKGPRMFRQPALRGFEKTPHQLVSVPPSFNRCSSPASSGDSVAGPFGP